MFSGQAGQDMAGRLSSNFDLCCASAEWSLKPEQLAAAAAGQRSEWRAGPGNAEHAVWASGELIWDAICAASPCKAASLCLHLNQLRPCMYVIFPGARMWTEKHVQLKWRVVSPKMS